jgi:hypothetical protein|tara:strand:- start:2758 stop:2940 length:183 start_codon:yes stop_codon:yes gene_type:complete
VTAGGGLPRRALSQINGHFGIGENYRRAKVISAYNIMISRLFGTRIIAYYWNSFAQEFLQ